MTEPFTIDVPNEALAAWRDRLAATCWPPVLEAGWGEGTDDAFARKLAVDLARFDWRDAEARLNRFPQFRTTIDGMPIHFFHLRGRGRRGDERPQPLILTHGWPSSVVEWLRIAPSLADPGAHGGDPDDAFDVVIPSLPGYPLSGPPGRTGVTPRVIAGAWVRLMASLGYNRFLAHGCDWGAYVTSLMALNHPRSVIAAHMGMVSLGAPRRAVAGGASRSGFAYAEAKRRWAERERGYIAIQSTKPQTLAYALADSPIGQAAWIAEKWRGWSDPATPIAREALLTTIALYWFTGTIHTANRLYLESARAPVALLPGQRVETPCGFFLERPSHPDDDRTPRPGAPSRQSAERAFNVQHWFESPRGGHFPALEVPDLLIAELRAFFAPYRD